MPFVAVPSAKLGVTVKPPCTALSTVTANEIAEPSVFDALPMDTVAVSSLVIVPVAVSLAVTVSDVPETARPTVNVSPASTTSSSVVVTVKVCCSPFVPAKLMPVVFSE